MSQRSRRRKELALRGQLKNELMEECEGRCQSCGKLPDWRGLGLAHLIPVSQGGLTSKENCRMWCGVCHDLDHGIVDK